MVTGIAWDRVSHIVNDKEKGKKKKGIDNSSSHGSLAETKKRAETKESGSGERFSENIGEIVRTRDVPYGDLVGVGVMPNDMVFNLDMLRARVKRLVARQDNGAAVVDEERGGCVLCITDGVQQGAEPDRFFGGFGRRDVFGFSRRVGDSSLFPS